MSPGLSPATTASTPEVVTEVPVASVPQPQPVSRVPANRRRDKPQLSCNLCRRRKYVGLVPVLMKVLIQKIDLNVTEATHVQHARIVGFLYHAPMPRTLMYNNLRLNESKHSKHQVQPPCKTVLDSLRNWS